MMRAAAGVTAATGSRAKRMITSPMVAFQKPMTDQGSVTANSATSEEIGRAEVRRPTARLPAARPVRPSTARPA